MIFAHIVLYLLEFSTVSYRLLLSVKDEYTSNDSRLIMTAACGATGVVHYRNIFVMSLWEFSCVVYFKDHFY